MWAVLCGRGEPQKGSELGVACLEMCYRKGFPAAYVEDALVETVIRGPIRAVAMVHGKNNEHLN